MTDEELDMLLDEHFKNKVYSEKAHPLDYFTEEDYQEWKALAVKDWDKLFSISIFFTLYALSYIQLNGENDRIVPPYIVKMTNEDKETSTTIRVIGSTRLSIFNYF